MLPPFNDNFENWLESLRNRKRFLKESWENDEPYGLWTWYYEENGQKECELKFDNGYPTYFRSWYEDGSEKEECRYKDFFPIEPFSIRFKNGIKFTHDRCGWHPVRSAVPKTHSSKFWLAFVISFTISYVITRWLI